MLTLAVEPNRQGRQFGPNGQAILLAYQFFLLQNNNKDQLPAFLQQDMFQLYNLRCITTSQINNLLSLDAFNTLKCAKCVCGRSKVRCEGAHLLCGTLSRRGLS